ncbi:MAG TPA: hypothetical protein PLK05_11645 [Steroidobacteraceae bacterium]|nr:hypothetical protein [Steroidobacteraceae bacterium]
MARDWESESRSRTEEERARAAEAAAEAEAVSRERLGSGRMRSIIGGSGGGPGSTVRNVQAEREREQRIADDARRAAMDFDPTYTPDYAFEGVTDAGPTAFGEASADPYSIEAQRRALDMMRAQAETTGFTPAEQSMMASAQRAAEQTSRGQRQADMQALEARGMGGSGMSMMAGQMAADSGADRAADFGAQSMMAAQQRALSAMSNYGAQASQMRGQSADESFSRAGGMDAWNQALAQRAQGVEGRNAERYNEQQNQGQANRFQREALAQGLYGMDATAAENERARADASRERQAQRESDQIVAGTQAVGSAVGGMGGM